MHEAQQHNKNSFITLTLNEQTLASRREQEPRFPVPLLSEKSAGSENSATSSNREEDEPAQQDSLVKRDLQLFVKKLRKSQDKDGLAKVKYYAVGEYGENYGRPHYHAALFGEDFSDDRYVWRTTESGHTVYRSPRLEETVDPRKLRDWRTHVRIRSICNPLHKKKINGPMAKEHYKRYDPTTGEIYWITPEFNLMSRGGRKGKGIAATWLETYKDDVYPHDYVIMNGQKLKPPRYYDNQLAASDQIGAILMKLEREFSARSQRADNTPKRLAAKEKVAQAKLNLGKRKLK